MVRAWGYAYDALPTGPYEAPVRPARFTVRRSVALGGIAMLVLAAVAIVVVVMSEQPSSSASMSIPVDLEQTAQPTVNVNSIMHKLDALETEVHSVAQKQMGAKAAAARLAQEIKTAVLSHLKEDIREDVDAKLGVVTSKPAFVQSSQELAAVRAHQRLAKKAAAVTAASVAARKRAASAMQDKKKKKNKQNTKSHHDATKQQHQQHPDAKKKIIITAHNKDKVVGKAAPKLTGKALVMAKAAKELEKAQALFAENTKHPHKAEQALEKANAAKNAHQTATNASKMKHAEHELLKARAMMKKLHMSDDDDQHSQSDDDDQSAMSFDDDHQHSAKSSKCAPMHGWAVSFC